MEFRNSAFSILGSFFSSTSNSLLTLLYPQSCRICDKSVELRTDGFICGECWQNTHIFSDADIACQKCGTFLKSGLTDAVVFCRRCENDAYDAAKSIGRYEKALAAAVLNLKRKPFLPIRLQNLISQAFANSAFQDTDLIIPIPLSVSRLRERGFNQSALIAQVITRETNLLLDEITLRRATHTAKHRAGMDRKARRESVDKSFEVVRPRLIEGKNVLLIDDVFTSGATASSCAEVLKQNGANKVYVFTIARAA